MTDADDHRDALIIAEISSAIMPMLKGKGPAIQTAVLGDLISMCLAGHFMLDDANQINREATEAMREEILQGIVGLARDLIPANEADLLVRLENQTRGKRR
jgi:hypothetical protein